MDSSYQYVVEYRICRGISSCWLGSVQSSFLTTEVSGACEGTDLSVAMGAGLVAAVSLSALSTSSGGRTGCEEKAATCCCIISFDMLVCRENSKWCSIAQIVHSHEVVEKLPGHLGRVEDPVLFRSWSVGFLDLYDKQDA
eukprot:scaffold270771_cov31-Attheya_sp.AAC.1